MIKIIRKIDQNGLTLVEVLIATAVLLITTLALIVAYMRCMQLNELSQNTFIALSEAKTQMETVKNDLRIALEDDGINVNTVIAGYNGVGFSPGMAINGMGVTYIDTTDPDFYEITVSFSWIENNGRLIGEDADLDGAIDGGEDINGNGMLDSYVQLVNLVYTQ